MAAGGGVGGGEASFPLPRPTSPSREGVEGLAGRGSAAAPQHLPPPLGRPRRAPLRPGAGGERAAVRAPTADRDQASRGRPKARPPAQPSPAQDGRGRRFGLGPKRAPAATRARRSLPGAPPGGQRVEGAPPCCARINKPQPGSSSPWFPRLPVLPWVRFSAGQAGNPEKAASLRFGGPGRSGSRRGAGLEGCALDTKLGPHERKCWTGEQWGGEGTFWA